MSNDKGGRKILWWTLPISPDDSAEVGGKMIKTILIWVGVVVVLIAIIVLIQAIA